MRTRLVVAVIAIAVVAAACGNSSSGKKSSSGGGGSGTTVSAADRNKNVPVSAPGVTDSEIGVAVITSATNIIGGEYAQYADGIQAYFDMVNADGGIYGRQLKIKKNRDDKMFENQAQVKASLAEDNAFATFVATPQLTGSRELEEAGMPTFIWNINPEMTGKQNIFANAGALCFGCISQNMPYLAKEEGLSKVAVLAYGVTASSVECGQALVDSFEKYPSAQVVYSDLTLQFAQADLSAQVSAMAEKGAQMVLTCMDQKEALVLAKEMAKQRLNAIQVLPNGYDAKYVADNAQYLEGYIVSTQFTPLDYQPMLDEQKLFEEWTGKSGKDVVELTIMGWIAANEFVKGLELAGPEFSQQKVIDGLNTVKDFSANGFVVPIDWTTQHEEPKGKPTAERYECFTGVKVRNGKFEPLPRPAGKPWACMKGGSQGTAPTLTTDPDFVSFGPTG